MATTTCNFGGSTEIAGPISSSVKTIASRVTALSDGGSRYVYDGNAFAIDQWTLQFAGLSALDKGSLQGFYDAQEGPTNVWNYTHTDRSTLEVRFIDTELNWSRDNAGSWGVTVTLETVERI